MASRIKCFPEDVDCDYTDEDYDYPRLDYDVDIGKGSRNIAHEDTSRGFRDMQRKARLKSFLRRMKKLKKKQSTKSRSFDYEDDTSQLNKRSNDMERHYPFSFIIDSDYDNSQSKNSYKNTEQRYPFFDLFDIDSDYIDYVINLPKYEEIGYDKFKDTSRFNFREWQRQAKLEARKRRIEKLKRMRELVKNKKTLYKERNFNYDEPNEVPLSLNLRHSFYDSPSKPSRPALVLPISVGPKDSPDLFRPIDFTMPKKNNIPEVPLDLSFMKQYPDRPLDLSIPKNLRSQFRPLDQSMPLPSEFNGSTECIDKSNLYNFDGSLTHIGHSYFNLNKDKVPICNDPLTFRRYLPTR